jgi:hypothetical protein
MEDEYFFGRRLVRVDGEVVYSGRTVLSDHSGAYQFDLAGQPAFLKISTNGIRYFYDLVAQPAPSAASIAAAKPKVLAQDAPSLARVALSVVFGLGMGFALVVLTDGRVWREPLVMVAGGPIDAIVTRATTTSSGAHRIDYRFDVGGHGFTHGGFITEERWNRARSLGVIPVRYLALAPEVNAFDPEPGDVLVDAVIVLVISATAGWSLVDAARELGVYRVWKRLSTTGVDIVGHVTRVRKLRNQYLIVVGCALDYEYTVAGAGEFRGQSRRFALDLATDYPIGSPLRIRYDPDRPGDTIVLTPSA